MILSATSLQKLSISADTDFLRMILFLIEIVNFVKTKSALDKRLILWSVTYPGDNVLVFSNDKSNMIFGLNSLDNIFGDIFKLNLFSVKVPAKDLMFHNNKQAISSGVT